MMTTTTQAQPIAPQSPAIVTVPSGSTSDNTSPASTVAASPPGVAQEAPAKRVTITPQFAALAKKDRDLAAKQSAFDAREKALVAREAELAHVSKADEELARDPLAFMARKGWTYDKLTEKLLSGELKAPNVANMALEELRKENDMTRQEVTALKNLLAERDARTAEEKANYVVDAHRQKLNAHLTSQAEKYELITSQGAQADVFNLIERHFLENGTILGFDEAAGVIEEALEENVTKLLNAKKIKAKLAPPAAVETAKTLPAERKSGLETLSNSAASASIPAATVKTPKKTKAELSAEAVQILTEKWKK